MKTASLALAIALLSFFVSLFAPLAAAAAPGVALVEEPISSAPSLYQGLPLAADGGSVRLVAVPDFGTPSSLVYTWNEDDRTLESSSGVGKSVIIVDAPLPYRSAKVSVSVSTADGSLTGAASIVLESQAPTLRLYVDDPLQGILFDQALGASFAVKSETTLFAAPYSFATDNGLPQINWFLNGGAADQGSLITLRPTGSGRGSATLSANASGLGTQATAAASLSLTFGDAGSTIFGL